MPVGGPAAKGERVDLIRALDQVAPFRAIAPETRRDDHEVRRLDAASDELCDASHNSSHVTSLVM
ncbi:hypothetical protein ACFL59_08020, partial [Planctomycetota bacterium]